MQTALIDELKSLLRSSDAKLRKHWATRICAEQVSVESLMGLLHGDEKTAERFTWLIGDLLDEDRSVVEPVVPMLFELRNQIPFPGMLRTVAKCLWYVGLPENLEAVATDELFKWLAEDKYAVGVKHYTSKALFELAKTGSVDCNRLAQILSQQAKHANKAHACRMNKLQIELAKICSTRD